MTIKPFVGVALVGAILTFAGCNSSSSDTKLPPVPAEPQPPIPPEKYGTPGYPPAPPGGATAPSK